MAKYYQSLLSSTLAEKVDLDFVQTSSQKRTLSNSGRATFSNLISALEDCVRFTQATLHKRPQIAHIGTAYGLSFLKHSICVLVARILGSRILLHPHCSLSVLYVDRSTWWRWFFRKIVQLTNGVIALSEEWFNLCSIVPNSQVYYLPNAIDITPFHPIAIEHLTSNRRSGSLRLLYLGYVGRAKGSFDLIEAASKIYSKGLDLSIDLVGDELTPGEWNQLRERIDHAELNDVVRLHPPVYNSEKLEFFRKSDIFVYPSYHEGMPLAVLEAMACALPIIATRAGGLADLVINGVNGFLVQPGRPDELAASIENLASNRELRCHMQQKSYQLATEQYDIEQHVIQLVEVYEKVISGS